MPGSYILVFRTDFLNGLPSSYELYPILVTLSISVYLKFSFFHSSLVIQHYHWIKKDLFDFTNRACSDKKRKMINTREMQKNKG
jgi:hypothetical protein